MHEIWRRQDKYQPRIADPSEVLWMHHCGGSHVGPQLGSQRDENQRNKQYLTAGDWAKTTGLVIEAMLYLVLVPMEHCLATDVECNKIGE